MNDETYVFISDVADKSKTASSAFRKGKRGGCTLPHENMSYEEKAKLNGSVVMCDMNAPMIFTDFCALSTDLKKEYLKNLVTNYDATTATLATMFCVSESIVKQTRKTLGVEITNKTPDPTKWSSFIASYEKKLADIRKPLTREEYDNLTLTLRKSYLAWVIGEKKFSVVKIARMLNMDHRILKKNLDEFRIKGRGRGGYVGEEYNRSWNEFVSMRPELFKSEEADKETDIPAEPKAVEEVTEESLVTEEVSEDIPAEPEVVEEALEDTSVAEVVPEEDKMDDIPGKPNVAEKTYAFTKLTYESTGTPEDIFRLALDSVKGYPLKQFTFELGVTEKATYNYPIMKMLMRGANVYGLIGNVKNMLDAEKVYDLKIEIRQY